MAAALADRGHRVRTVVPGTELRAVSTDRYAADLASPESIARLHQLIAGNEGDRIGCVVNLLPLAERDRGPGTEPAEAAFRLTQSLFLLLRRLHDDLSDAVEVGGGVVLNVTAIDGQFGLAGCDAIGAAAAGTHGLCKALQRELPAIRVRTIDVDPGLSRSALAARLLDELCDPDGPPETSLTAGRRWTLNLVQKPAAPGPLPIDQSSVVLITGGAQGITADVARGLAAARPTLIVLGRSPLSEDEPAETRGLDVAALRTLLIDRRCGRNEAVSPAEIEREVAGILRARAVRDNLESFRRAGARVEYHSLDVRNRPRLGGLVADLYRRFGRIDGLIHGAGVIHDKLIADKSPDLFADVFRTKVDPALHLAELLQPESLRFFALFSSVSGRFGNRGQTDYSAANECLNKLARRLAREWPDTRVVAINWGPWDAGMVSDALRSAYASRGIELIPVERGVQAFLDEISATNGDSEVVVSCSVPAFVRSTRRR